MTPRNAIKLLNLHKGKKVEVLFKLPVGWFKEQLQNYDTALAWFREKVSPDCYADAMYHGNSIQYYTFSLEAKCADIVKFLKEYGHKIGGLEVLPGYL